MLSNGLDSFLRDVFPKQKHNLKKYAFCFVDFNFILIELLFWFVAPSLLFQNDPFEMVAEKCFAIWMHFIDPIMLTGVLPSEIALNKWFFIENRSEIKIQSFIRANIVYEF